MEKSRYHLDLIFANLFFGANFSFYVSLTRNYLDFQQIFMLQVLSAALFFIPFALFMRGFWRIGWRDAGQIVPVSLLVIYGWMYLLLWGSSYTTPIDASVIATLGPAFTLMLDHLLHPLGTSHPAERSQKENQIHLPNQGFHAIFSNNP